MNSPNLWMIKPVLVSIIIAISICNAEVIKITPDNLDATLGSSELVFVNFYADWCRFSQMLAPIFNNAEVEIQKRYPQPGKVLLAKVDCDKETGIAQKYSVSKYPTMKLFRNGQMMKREYRGSRSVEALAAFIDEQMKDPMTVLQSVEEMENLEQDRSKRTIIGYFETKDCNEYRSLESISKMLKDDCRFYVGIGDVSRHERTTGDNVIFRPAGNQPEMVFLGSLANTNLLKNWITDKCVPLVREITFANGEELTEEGLPFLILFHKGEDTDSLEKYKKEISRSLITEKSRITFLHADCEKFSHPLHHLGKTANDCPLIAIDSFKHMYLFPDFKDMDQPGKLKQFVTDLHSGKLHREFHHGPDPTEKPKVDIQNTNLAELVNSPDFQNFPEEVKNELLNRAAQLELQQQGDVNTDPNDERGEETTTIESVFKQLKPSEHRYTLVNKDEL